MGQGTSPGGDTLGDQHPEAEGERVGTFMQDGMAKLFVAGVQPGGGGSDLTGFRNGWSVQVSSRGVRVRSKG